MYQSNSFYIERQNGIKNFSPQVHSIFNILADETYTHFNTEDEKSQHLENTTAFIHCVDGKGEITLKNGKKIILQKKQICNVKIQRYCQIQKYIKYLGLPLGKFCFKTPD